MQLRYGINPGQAAHVSPVGDGDLPFRVLAGEPSYVNILDGLNSWQLVRSIHMALGLPAATSFKHVSPAGAAVAGPIDQVMSETWKVDGAVGSVASAYVRARDADPKSSYGDFVAVSHPVDRELTEVLRSTICDGLIAPGFEEGTVEVLSKKKGGTMLVLEIDPTASPALGWERRDVFGATLAQEVSHPDFEPIGRQLSGQVSDSSLRDAVLGLLTVRFTQSNSVGFARDGMMIGIGAGQQSRVDCTRIAGQKADVWWLRRHAALRDLRFAKGVSRQDRLNLVIRTLEGDLTIQERRLFSDMLVGPLVELSEQERMGWLAQLREVTFVSDGLVPFRDNVDQAARHGVELFIEPGGSLRSSEITEACAEYGMKHIQTGMRLFHH